jgi:hypothetical protein
VVLPQDSFDEFEFRTTDSLQDKFPIARIVEKAATFAAGTKLGQGLEICIEHIAQDVIWAKTI